MINSTFTVNIFIVLFYSFLIYFGRTATKKRNLVFILISTIHLLILYIFKNNELLPDVSGYMEYFKSFKIGFELGYEKGWNYLNYFLTLFSRNPNVLIFILSTIIILSFNLLIKNYSPLPWLSLILYLCTLFIFSLFILRQYLAIPLCALTIPYIIKRKFLPFLILTALAISFHTSAAVWLFAYFIYSIKLSKKWVFLGSIIIIALIMNINSLLIFLVSQNIRNLQYYVDNQQSFSIFPFLASLIPLILAIIFLKRNIWELTGVYKLFFIMIIINITLNLINTIGSNFNYMFRVAAYFSYAEIFFIPYIIKQINNKLISSVTTVLVCIFYFAWANTLINKWGFELTF